MYDLTGNLVTEYDLTGIKLIDSRLEYVKILNLGPNSYAILIPDACLFGDALYLLITSNDESGPFTNRILVIDINKNSFKVNHILDLGDQWFNTFCVNEDHLWAVSQQGINRFSLN